MIRMNDDDTGRICQELAYLLHAGISTAEALTLLAADEPRSAYKGVLDAMAKLCDEGGSLAGAFTAAGCFPDYVCGLVSTGESSGRSEEALESLAANCAARAALDKRLRSALLYPSILLLIMLAVIAVLLIYVLPVFNDVYAQLGSGLTGVAGGLLSVGRALGSAAPVLLALLVAAVLLLTLFSVSAEFRNTLLSAWQKRRGDKKLAGKINSARFAQAMSMCLGSGMPLENAIEQSALLLPDNSRLQAKSDKCLALLGEGEALSAALQASKLLPGAECRLLETGIRGGSGERAMEQIARHLTGESDDAIDAAVDRVEPTMVVIASVLVGVILLSVMLPLINIMSAIA